VFRASLCPSSGEPECAAQPGNHLMQY